MDAETALDSEDAGPRGRIVLSGRGDTSVTNRIFDILVGRIQSGEWPIGFVIPSERAMIEEFGVSRIALRESLSRLRALGVLKIAHGKRTTVARMDSSALGRLFPLMLSLEGEQTFQDFFDARLTMELRTSYLAARNRTDENLARMDALLEQMASGPSETAQEWSRKDLALHLEIARATQNRLFPPMLEALSGFVFHVQQIGINGYPNRRRIALKAHFTIVEAIRYRDAARAQSEMEAHLRSGADHIAKTGILSGGKVRPPEE